MAIFQKVVLQVSTCHVIAQKKLSSLVSGGRTQYKVHSTHQIPSIGQLWQFFENVHFRVSIYDALAQKKHNYLVNGGRTQDEVHANHQIPVIGYHWLQVAIFIYYSIIFCNPLVHRMGTMVKMVIKSNT